MLREHPFKESQVGLQGAIRLACLMVVVHPCVAFASAATTFTNSCLELALDLAFRHRGLNQDPSLKRLGRRRVVPSCLPAVLVLMVFINQVLPYHTSDY